ncbi:MAG: hypothetical protein HOJ41_09400, partial [Rhodospirillaceae bacterium]|nr:hypothetical protein [Rhodospirillaceae bacterium]
RRRWRRRYRFISCWQSNSRAGSRSLVTGWMQSSCRLLPPAAMRLAIPEARPSIYLSLSLGITFPFNLTLGIPIYVILGNIAGS